MRDIVGAETHGKHQKCSQSHPDGPQAPASVNVLQPGQNPDEIDVAKATNQERNAEKYNAELQADGQEHLQLVWWEILIAHRPVHVKRSSRHRDIEAQRVVQGLWADKGHNEHNAQVDDGENPEEDACGHGVFRPPLQRVLDGESHAEVALHAHRSQEEGASVDGHEENEAW